MSMNNNNNNNNYDYYPSWLLCDKYKIESLLRTMICVTVGCILTIKTEEYFIGWFASFLPIFYPKLVYAMMGLMPYDQIMILWSFAIVSLLFYICENYGKHWLLVGYGVYILFITQSLYFGGGGTRTSTTTDRNTSNNATSNTGRSSSSIDIDIIGSYEFSKTSGLACFYTGISSLIIVLFLDKLNYDENPNNNTEDNNNTHTQPLLTVSEMWTMSSSEEDSDDGLFISFLKVWYLAWMCIIIMILVPFPRTSRSLLTNHILPQVMEDILVYASTIKNNTNNNNNNNVDNVDNDDVVIKKDEEEDEEERQRRQKKKKMMMMEKLLIHHTFELNNMSKGTCTKYEPIIFWRRNNNDDNDNNNDNNAVLLFESLTKLMEDLAILSRVTLFAHANEIKTILQELHPIIITSNSNDDNNNNNNTKRMRRREPYIIELCINALRNYHHGTTCTCTTCTCTCCNNNSNTGNNSNTQQEEEDALELLRNSPSAYERYMQQATIDDDDDDGNDDESTRKSQKRNYHHTQHDTQHTRLSSVDNVEFQWIIDDNKNTTTNTTTTTTTTKKQQQQYHDNLEVISVQETIHTYSIRFVLEKVECVKQSTIQYLDCLNNNNNNNNKKTTTTTTTKKKKKLTMKEIISNRIEYNLIMWIIIEPIQAILTRLYQTIVDLFKLLLASSSSPSSRSSSSQWITWLWSLKYTLGCVFLLSLDLYFPAYATLGIDDGKQSVFTSTTHQGWQILGYAMAFKPTVEGTFKKGLMRIAGTVAGGIIGWIGVTICSGGYIWLPGDNNNDDGSPSSSSSSSPPTPPSPPTMNPYGTVMWTTFFSIVAAYLSTDAGPTHALFGGTYSHVFLGFYFAMVQSLVMLEVYVQPGTRDAVTVTRVVATIIGVIVAMIVQLIPPNIYGRFPSDIIPCLNEIQNVFDSTVLAVLSLHPTHHHKVDDDDNDDDIVHDTNNNAHNKDDEESPLVDTTDGNRYSSFSTKMHPSSSMFEKIIVSGRQKEQIIAVQKLVNHRLYLAKDAGTLSFLPMMKLDDRLVPLLKEMTITLDYLSRWERIVSGLQGNPDRDALVEELRVVMKLQGKTAASIDHSYKDLKDDASDGLYLFPSLAKLIENRLLDHERDLKSLI